jgi:hypothetical protein
VSFGKGSVNFANIRIFATIVVILGAAINTGEIVFNDDFQQALSANVYCRVNPNLASLTRCSRLISRNRH